MKAFQLLLLAATVGTTFAIAAPAEATPIVGTATITGTDSIDGTNLTNNTSFTFTGAPSVSSVGTGDLAAFVIGASATINVSPWTFTGPFVPQIPFLTLTNGASSVVFNLDTSLTIQSRSGNNTNSALTLFLLGHLVPSGPAFTGIDPNAASISFAATAAFTNGGYTISLSAPPAGGPRGTPVPEPATLALLGAGLLAAGFSTRWKNKSKATV